MNLLSNITMFLGEELKRFTNIYYAKKNASFFNRTTRKIK